MTADDALLARLERYYDGVPRPHARTEEVGPFTLFVALQGWPYYARPRLDNTVPISAADVHAVLAHQRERGVPMSIEWVDDVTPGLAETVESLDLTVHRCPLLVLDGSARGDAGSARMLGPDDSDDLRLSRAAVGIAFGNDGTAVGDPGLPERDAAAATTDASIAADMVRRMHEGYLFQAAVYDPERPDAGPIGGGAYSPIGTVAEVTGVGVLPAYRRRGLAAEITYVLAADAQSRGVTTVFCSADSEDVARVYARIGFTRVGTACILES